jgi:hypothetical protein
MDFYRTTQRYSHRSELSTVPALRNSNPMTTHYLNMSKTYLPQGPYPIQVDYTTVIHEPTAQVRFIHINLIQIFQNSHQDQDGADNTI